MSVLDSLFAVFAKIPGADRFEGARAVAIREVLSNIKSLRMLVVTILLGLALIGGAAGISAFAGSGGPDTSEAWFVHAAYPNGLNGSKSVVVFFADAFGTPHAGQAVVIFTAEGTPGPGGGVTANVVDEKTTDANGLVRFDGLTGNSYMVGTRETRGIATKGFVDLSGPIPEIDIASYQYDLGRNGSQADFILHAVSANGSIQAGADILVNGTPAATTDARGYAHLVLEPGMWNITVRSPAGEAPRFAQVGEPAPSILAQGGDLVLYIVAVVFIPLILPIVTIAVAHDAIARERAQGSLDFVLSRPTTRYGILLGKFVGAMVALLIPVLGMLAIGALVISSMSGSPVTAGFFGGVVAGLILYMAAYTLLLLILSTLAKTTGTAVMFGVLLWLMFGILWNIVLFLVTGAAGLNQSDRAFYEVQIYTGLFNPNSLYTAVVSAAFPLGGTNPFEFNGQEVLAWWVPPVAAIVWVAVLFVVALVVFDRRAE